MSPFLKVCFDLSWRWGIVPTLWPDSILSDKWSVQVQLGREQILNKNWKFCRNNLKKPRHCSIVVSQAISFTSSFQSFDSFKFGINVWDACITIQIATGFWIYAARRRPFSTIPFLIESVKAQICTQCIVSGAKILGGLSCKLYLTIENWYFSLPWGVTAGRVLTYVRFFANWWIRTFDSSTIACETLEFDGLSSNSKMFVKK